MNATKLAQLLFPNNRLFSTGVCNAFLVFGAKRFFHATDATRLNDYYHVLGVANNAEPSEIKKAYYQLAKKFHPDTNSEDADAPKFHQLNKAYQVLTDEEKRSLYDQVGHDAFEQGAGGTDADAGLADIIQDIFEKRFGGQDVKACIELSFMEAIQGCSKTLSFQTSLPCEACGGTGAPAGTRPETCKPCKGSGVVSSSNTHFFTCRNCGGTGKIMTNFCKSCDGVRVVGRSKTVKINIPPGIDSNETIKMLKNGGVDPEGNHRDLYIGIKVKEDPVFRRKGADIHVDAVLSATQATRGGTIQVPTLTGNFPLKVPRGTQSGQKVVLKRKGIKMRNSVSLGDQYVHFKISTPEESTQELKENDRAAAAYG